LDFYKLEKHIYLNQFSGSDENYLVNCTKIETEINLKTKIFLLRRNCCFADYLVINLI